jgi:nitroreductase
VADLRELRRLEPWFYRAPSAHNTQPWLLDYAPDRIELQVDPSRHLAVGDPTRRDLYLSLGCFVEAVLIAAASEGLSLEFRHEPWRFVEGSEPYRTDFTLEHLERRQTSRLHYEPARLSQEVLSSVQAQLKADRRVHELPNAAVIDLFTTADRWVYDSEPLVEELRSWLRLSKRDPRYARDGLTYECLALSRLEARGLALLLHPRIYPLARGLGVHRALTASARSVLEREGSVLVLEAPEDAPSELMVAGRALMRAWLALAAAGYATHPLSQILDCQETERELMRRLNLPAGTHLLSVFRAGRSKPAPRSHRLISAPG